MKNVFAFALAALFVAPVAFAQAPTAPAEGAAAAPAEKMAPEGDKKPAAAAHKGKGKKHAAKKDDAK